jgi:hypothetical protein
MQWYTSATHLWSTLQKRRYMQYANLFCGIDFLLVNENDTSLFETPLSLLRGNGDVQCAVDQERKLGCGGGAHCW